MVIKKKTSPHRVQLVSQAGDSQEEPFGAREDEEEDEVHGCLSAHALAASHGDEADKGGHERHDQQRGISHDKVFRGPGQGYYEDDAQGQQELEHQYRVDFPGEKVNFDEFR